MLLTFLNTAINKVINPYLGQLEPQSKLTLLEGKTISLRIRPWQSSWQILIQNQQITIVNEPASTPSLTITATPLGLLGTIVAAQAANPADSWLISDLNISGDLQVAQQLISLLIACRPDWEAVIAAKFGQRSAQIMAHVWDTITAYVNNTASSMSTNLSTYLQEERQWVPPAPLVTEFIAEVDDLSMRVDRLAAALHGFK